MICLVENNCVVGSCETCAIETDAHSQASVSGNEIFGQISGINICPSHEDLGDFR